MIVYFILERRVKCLSISVHLHARVCDKKERLGGHVSSPNVSTVDILIF